MKKKPADNDHSNHSNNSITKQELNKLTAQSFDARLVQANLAIKNDIAALIKMTDFDDKLKYLNKKVTSNKTKHIFVENKLKKIKKKKKNDSSLFIGQACFFIDGTQVYLTSQTLYYTLKRLGNTEKNCIMKI